MEKQIAIGIDIGGTHTVIGVVDKNGQILQELKPSIKTPAKSLNPNNDKYISEKLLTEYMSEIYSAIRWIISEVKKSEPEIQIVGIGIGAPNGCFYSGEIEQAPNLPFVGNVKVVEKIANEFPEIEKVKLTNDANAAAIGELIYGGAKGMNDFAMVTLGTGVGSGFVVNGQILYGKDGFAGEFGHTIIIPNGRMCGCGISGHLEAYCSASGIVRTYFELMAFNNVKNAALADVPFSKLTPYDIYLAAKNNDKTAIDTFNRTGEILGIGFANIVHYFSPEAIFLFGGVTSAGDYLIKPAIKVMEDNLLPGFKNKVKVLLSSLPDSSVAVLGASALVW